MFKNIIFSLLLLALGNTVNAAAGGASSAPNYEALAAQQKLEIWHDVQPAAFYGGLPEPITRAIGTYQAIVKTDRKTLPSRIDALQAIASLTTEKSPNMMLLHQTATNKAIYLQGILEQQPFLKALRLEKDGSGKFRTGVSVKNDNFPTEFLYYMDPGYRTVGSLMLLQTAWKNALSQNPKTPELFMWLETATDLPMQLDPILKKYNMTGPKLLKARQVYFDADGRAYHQLYGNRAKPPKIFDGTETWPLQPAPTGVGRDNDYLYNIDLDGNLYISAEGEMEKHSHILRGDLVLSAGMIGFNTDGFMIKIDTASGHFQPSSNQLKQALQKLTAKFNPKILSQTQFGHYTSTGFAYPETMRVDPNTLPYQKRQIQLTVLDVAGYKDLFKHEDLATSVTIKPLSGPSNKITLGALLEQAADFPDYVRTLKEANDARDKLDQPIFLHAQAEAAIVAVGKKIFIKDIGWDNLTDPFYHKKIELDPSIREKITALDSTTTLKDFLSALKALQNSVQSNYRLSNLGALKDLMDSSINFGDINITNPASFEVLSQQYLKNIRFFLKAYEKAHAASLPDAEALNAITFEEKTYTAEKTVELYTQLYSLIYGGNLERQNFYNSKVETTPVIMAAIKGKANVYRDMIAGQDIQKSNDPKERLKARVRNMGRKAIDTNASAKIAEDDRIASEAEAARIAAQAAADQRAAAAKAGADRVAAEAAEAARIARETAEADAKRKDTAARTIQAGARDKLQRNQKARDAEAQKAAAAEAAESQRKDAAARIIQAGARDKLQRNQKARDEADRVAAEAAAVEEGKRRYIYLRNSAIADIEQTLRLSRQHGDPEDEIKVRVLAKLKTMDPEEIGRMVEMNNKPWTTDPYRFLGETDPDEINFDLSALAHPS